MCEKYQSLNYNILILPLSPVSSQQQPFCLLSGTAASNSSAAWLSSTSPPLSPAPLAVSSPTASRNSTDVLDSLDGRYVAIPTLYPLRKKNVYFPNTQKKTVDFPNRRSHPRRPCPRHLENPTRQPRNCKVPYAARARLARCPSLKRLGLRTRSNYKQ